MQGNFSWSYDVSHGTFFSFEAGHFVSCGNDAESSPKLDDAESLLLLVERTDLAQSTGSSENFERRSVPTSCGVCPPSSPLRWLRCLGLAATGAASRATAYPTRTKKQKSRSSTATLSVRRQTLQHQTSAETPQHLLLSFFQRVHGYAEIFHHTFVASRSMLVHLG